MIPSGLERNFIFIDFQTNFDVFFFFLLSKGLSVVKVQAKDGDLGEPRPVALSIEEDNLGYFQLETSGSGVATVVTSGIPIDREHPAILQSGGIYTFNIKV